MKVHTYYKRHKEGICGAIVLLLLVIVIAAVGMLESEAISCGQALLISAVCFSGIIGAAKKGGLYWEAEKEKAPRTTGIVQRRTEK